MQLTSKVPHLLIAYYEWILENTLTPHIRVRVRDGDGIPKNHSGIHEGTIVLNIDPSAIRDFGMTDEAVVFRVRFGGKDTPVQILFNDIMLVFAKETRIGHAFEESDLPQESVKKVKLTEPIMVTINVNDEKPPEPPRPTSKPTLRIVK